MNHLVINLTLFWYLKVIILVIHATLTLTQQQINETTVYNNTQTSMVIYPYQKITKHSHHSHKSSSHKPPAVVRSPFIPDYMVWSNFSKTFINDTINRIQSRRSNNISVYYAMFAGRAELIKIHFQYTDILLKLGLVNEVHIWDFTNGNVGDAD